jgi:16S rRNA (cytosine967-C5)-methyltransferase
MPSRATRSSISPARRAAFEILHRVETQDAYASALIAALPEQKLSREDRALTQEIVLGVLRWRKSLDYFIERFSSRRINRLDLPVLLALRIGLYQLRFLTRIPNSAAVNESVNLVKAHGTASAAGFVNAVLRKGAQHLDFAVEEIEDRSERASIELSHPRWMLKRWETLWGEEESRELALANNDAPGQTFRINTLRITAEELLRRIEELGVIVKPSTYVPGALTLQGGPVAALVEAAEDGLVYFQDEASMLVTLLLEPKPGDRILDLCAAPGSKTSHIAAVTQNESLIVAGDLHVHRLFTLIETCLRLGATCVQPLALDGTGRLPFVESKCRFDRILVDAPCSGTGTLRRHPEIKWRLQEADLARLAELQTALLANAAPLLEARGRLVYSTCSLEPEENEEIINRFLDSHQEFRVTRRSVYLDLAAGEFIRTFPHRHGMDGFFAAALERTEGHR